MKRFFYSHPLLTTILIVIFISLPSTGLVIPLVLEAFGIEVTALQFFLYIFGGPLLVLILALPFVCIPSLKCLDEALDELWQLKRDRKAFYAPQHLLTVEDAQAYIEQNLKRRKLKEFNIPLHHTETVTCVGIRVKDVTFSYKYSGDDIHPTYYLLYTTDQLDLSAWNTLQKQIDRQLLALETESLRRGCSKPAYAICILCNSAATTVTEQVHKIQSYQFTNAHVCVGIVPLNEWHLPAYRIMDNEPSKLARSLLGKGTFGLHFSTFPYKNNTEYTEEFYERVEYFCNSRIKDNVTDTQRKATRTGIRDLLKSIGRSPSVNHLEQWKTDLEHTSQIQDDEDT